MKIDVNMLTDMDCGNKVAGYAANCMAEECSIIGLDGIYKYILADVEVCIRN